MREEFHDLDTGLGLRYLHPPIREKKARRAQARAATNGQILRDPETYYCAGILRFLPLGVVILSHLFDDPSASVGDQLTFVVYLVILADFSLTSAAFARARVVVHPDSFTIVNLLRTYHVPDGNVANAALEPTGFPTICLADGTDITIAALQESPIRRFFGGTVDGHAFNYVLARGEHHPPQGPVVTTRLRWNIAQKVLAAAWVVLIIGNLIYAATLAT